MVIKHSCFQLLRREVLLTLLVSMTVFTAAAQQADSTDIVPVAMPENTESTTGEKEPDIFVISEVMPSFPGGENALKRYVKENTQAVSTPLAKNGMVYVKVIIRPDGTIDQSRTEVIRGLTAEHDAEALRVLRAMPTWSPALQRNKAVWSQYLIPVPFPKN